MNRENYRFFKLTRINNINISSEEFTRNAPKKIFLEKAVGYTKELTHIKVKLNKKLRFRIYDEFQNYSLDDNGDFIVDLDFPLGDWLFGYLMSFGENIEVLEPLYIREAMKKRLIEALNKY